MSQPGPGKSRPAPSLQPGSRRRPRGTAARLIGLASPQVTRADAGYPRTIRDHLVQTRVRILHGTLRIGRFSIGRVRILTPGTSHERTVFTLKVTGTPLAPTLVDGVWPAGKLARRTARFSIATGEAFAACKPTFRDRFGRSPSSGARPPRPGLQ